MLSVTLNVVRLIESERALHTERERQLAENALLHDFRSAFEDVDAGMAVLAVDGRFSHVNPKLERILGYDSEALVGVLLPRPARSQRSRRVQARVRRAGRRHRHGDRGRAEPPPPTGQRGVARGHDLPRRRGAGSWSCRRRTSRCASTPETPAAGERGPLPVARRAPAADRLPQRARHAGDGAVREPAGRDHARLPAVLVGRTDRTSSTGSSIRTIATASTPHWSACCQTGEDLSCEYRVSGERRLVRSRCARRARSSTDDSGPAAVRPGLHPRHLRAAPARGAAAARAEARGGRPARRRRRARDQHADPVRRRQRRASRDAVERPAGADRRPTASVIAGDAGAARAAEDAEDDADLDYLREQLPTRSTRMRRRASSASPRSSAR